MSAIAKPPAASFEILPDDDRVDPSVACSRCEAVCCRLTVVVLPEDDVPRHLVARDAHGLEVMARGEDGWCVALDPLRMTCGIYDRRPGVCRRFAMGGGYCRATRKDYYGREDAQGPR